MILRVVVVVYVYFFNLQKKVNQFFGNNQKIDKETI